MRKLVLTVAGAATALAIAVVSPAVAKGGPGWKAASGHPPGYSHGSKLGWGSANHPPGFSHGHKRGWRGRSYPPGWTHGHR